MTGRSHSIVITAILTFNIPGAWHQHYGTSLVTVLILFEPTDFLSKLIYPSAAVYGISQNLIPCRFVVALCCSCVVVLLMALYLDYFNCDKNE